MIEVKCPICGENNCKTLYEANFKFENINPDVFSARRMPETCHYRMVECVDCKMVYSNPILEDEKLALLYRDSKFTYADEVENIKDSYGYYIKQLDKYISERGIFLEVGCGNGFMLERAKDLGYEEVWGVEPSLHAVENASPRVKVNIINDILKEGLFKEDYFDAICFFQVLDHIPNATEFINLCYKLLKPGGVVLCITHDIKGLQAKILGEKSPIVDIEHTGLYSKDTLQKIFSKGNFKIKEAFNVYNTYTLKYWILMVPFNKSLKNRILKIGDKMGITKKKIRIKPGNIGIIAQK